MTLDVYDGTPLTGPVLVRVVHRSIAGPRCVSFATDIEPVWDVIKALRSLDDELGEQLEELRDS
jgi:predicted helicase